MPTKSKSSTSDKVLPQKGSGVILPRIEGTRAAGGGVDVQLQSMVRTMIEASEKQQDAKLNALETVINSKIDARPTLHQLIYVVGGFVGAALIAGIGAFIAIVSYGSGQFSAGSQMTSATYEQASEAKKLSEDAKKSADENGRQFNAILELLRRLEPKNE